jgi:hypothetical protein
VRPGLALAAFGSASSGPFLTIWSAAESNFSGFSDFSGFSGFSGAPHAGKGVLGNSTCHNRFKSASGLQGRLAIAQI